MVITLARMLVYSETDDIRRLELQKLSGVLCLSPVWILLWAPVSMLSVVGESDICGFDARWLQF